MSSARFVAAKSWDVGADAGTVLLDSRCVDGQSTVFGGDCNSIGSPGYTPELRSSYNYSRFLGELGSYDADCTRRDWPRMVATKGTSTSYPVIGWRIMHLRVIHQLQTHARSSKKAFRRPLRIAAWDSRVFPLAAMEFTGAWPWGVFSAIGLRQRPPPAEQGAN